MPGHGPNDESADLPVLTRAALRAQLQARLAGRLSAQALAAWAFNQFYAEDLGDLLLEPGEEDELRNLLDTLMFADEADFALDASALTALIGHLQP